jgi:hypothetical protein
MFNEPDEDLEATIGMAVLSNGSGAVWESPSEGE